MHRAIFLVNTNTIKRIIENFNGILQSSSPSSFRNTNQSEDISTKFTTSWRVLLFKSVSIKEDQKHFNRGGLVYEQE